MTAIELPIEEQFIAFALIDFTQVVRAFDNNGLLSEEEFETLEKGMSIIEKKSGLKRGK